MKKILLFIFIFINIFFLNFTKNKEEAVSLVSDDNIFKIYTLNTTLNTKNILNYMNEDIKIISLYPKTKINYKNNLKNYKYNFTITTNQNNLNLFINKYQKLLLENNYTKDANLISFTGIDLIKIDIYTNEINLLKLLNTGKFTLKNKL